MSEELKYRPDYVVTATDIIRDAIEAHGFSEPNEGYLENIVRVAFNNIPDNALIDTLMARLIATNYLLKTAVTEGTHDGWMPTAGAALNLNEQALAEAKQWRAK
jgi:hypothetical protein